MYILLKTDPIWSVKIQINNKNYSVLCYNNLLDDLVGVKTNVKNKKENKKILKEFNKYYSKEIIADAEANVNDYLKKFNYIKK